MGIGLITEDRKAQGLFLGQSLRSNVAVTIFGRLSRLGFLQYKKIDQRVQALVQKLKIRTPNLEQRVRNLSGGNQQKAVIARWLAVNPKILILDEPTRGIDVSSKAQIYRLMDEQVSAGKAVLLVSSYFPELLALCDRIAVMLRGGLGAARPASEWTEHALLMESSGARAVS